MSSPSSSCLTEYPSYLNPGLPDGAAIKTHGVLKLHKSCMDKLKAALDACGDWLPFHKIGTEIRHNKLDGTRVEDITTIPDLYETIQRLAAKIDEWAIEHVIPLLPKEEQETQYIASRHLYMESPWDRRHIVLPIAEENYPSIFSTASEVEKLMLGMISQFHHDEWNTYTVLAYLDGPTTILYLDNKLYEPEKGTGIVMSQEGNYRMYGHDPVCHSIPFHRVEDKRTYVVVHLRRKDDSFKRTGDLIERKKKSIEKLVLTHLKT